MEEEAVCLAADAAEGWMWQVPLLLATAHIEGTFCFRCSSYFSGAPQLWHDQSVSQLNVSAKTIWSWSVLRRKDFFKQGSSFTVQKSSSLSLPEATKSQKQNICQHWCQTQTHHSLQLKSVLFLFSTSVTVTKPCSFFKLHFQLSICWKGDVLLVWSSRLFPHHCLLQH